MRKVLLFTNLVFFLVSGFCQSPGKITIKGFLKDTLNESIPFATVMLLNPKDSTLQNFTTTSDKGEFRFTGIKNSSYLLKISHMTYMPFQKNIDFSRTETVDIGTLYMKPISTTLMEVVIKAAKAPLFIKGDTVEYDATTFKVPPGSTVEDLLRRLPGIDVDADGNISTQGKDVKRLYVDGKTFFGDDPKSATKNLGADVVSKVQVFDEKSEQTKLTGIDDGSKEKAMNLELKDEFKNGKFGKVSIAAGTEERWAGSGNFNRFNNKTQLSFIAYANNVNQTGVNWEDYGEFKGNNAFNNFDNGDFGFNARRRMFYFTTDDSPVSFYDGKGLTKNFGAGTNFNYDNKGTKFNASYFYNQTDLNYLQKSLRQTFIDSLNSFTKNDTLDNSNFKSSHSVGSRFEKEFNPNDRLIMKANFRLSTNDNESLNNQAISDFQLLPYNFLSIDNKTDVSSFKITSAAIYRHLFKKKGRSFAISGGYNLNITDGSENLNTLNDFFSAATPSEQIMQLIKNDKNIRELKSSILYSEPLSEKFFIETFYNFSDLSNFSNRQASDILSNNSRIDSLSVYYEQGTLYNRLGTILRYSYNGFNASAGIAGQSMQLKGLYSLDKGEEWLEKKDPRNYNNLTPSLQLNYDLNRQMHIELSYNNQISAPDFDALYPVKNTSNPSYQIVGNPELNTEKSHEVEFEFHYWNPASFSNINLSTTYTIKKDPIVYNQQTFFDPDKGAVTISTPENMDQQNSFRANVWTNVPIVKTKLSLSLNAGYNNSVTPTKINGLLDEINSSGINIGSNLNFTPNQKLVLTVGATTNFSVIKYDINNVHDQDYYNYTLRSSVKWQFEKNTFFESNFNYSVYNNDKFDFDQKLPIWNASLRRIVGKSKKFEIRLAAFDILNKNLTLSQYASKNFIEKSETNTLTRYITLGVTYNIKGFETKMQQRNRFMMM